MHMSEATYREFVTSRFGDDVSIEYEPIEDEAGARTGTRVIIRIPRDARETFRQAQFMRVAETTGGHDWDLTDEGSALRLEVETQYRLPERFSESSGSRAPESPHAAYVESLTGGLGGGGEGPTEGPGD